MSTPQSTSQMRARRVVFEEEVGPSSRPPPCQDPSPQHSQSPGSPKRDILKIARDFQACCDEVLSALDTPQSGGSPGSPEQGGCMAGNTNLVKPNLEEMLKLLQAATAYFEERNCHTNRLKQAINNVMEEIDGYRCLLDQFDPVVEGAMRMIPDYVQMWSSQAEGLANIHQCLNGENPVPNINAVNHPSQCVSQEAYSNLIWQMMSLCSATERQCRLSELMYSKLDEDREKIRQSLDQSEGALQYFDDLSSTLAGEEQQLLNQFKEKHLQVSQFLEEWQKGGEQLNQPTPSPMTTPEYSPEAGSSARCPDTPFFTPGASPTFHSPQTPTPELQERIRCLEDIKGRKKEVLEDLVQRYADLHGSILNEVKNIRDQHDVLNESKIAMEGVRERPAAAADVTRQPATPTASSTSAPAATPPPAAEPTPPAPAAEEPVATD